MTDTDLVIEEVRRSRCRMSEQCGHDVTRYLQFLQDFNSRYAAQVRKYRESHGPLAAAADTRRRAGQRRERVSHATHK